MKILFTGGSSFTGCWFISELAKAGHEVVATFRQRPEAYTDTLRRQRVEHALEHSTGVFDCSFGDPVFVDLVRNDSWDLLCHHAADATNYKSEDFDIEAALTSNTRNVATVLADLKKQNGAPPAVLLTGSVFENDEGAGSEGLPAFSPYGLSKSLTYQVFRYRAQRAGLALGKFVIANPFGPLEEPRFTAYLMKNWFAGQIPSVNTPVYVRDNIHISLLAKAYVQFAGQLRAQSGLHALRPSGYVESQGAFAQRFAAEMRKRLDLPCELELKRQTDFNEARVRINTDQVDGALLGWDEESSWAAIADYYAGIYRP
jgi:UDP-glucose 4-epimerase